MMVIMMIIIIAIIINSMLQLAFVVLTCPASEVRVHGTGAFSFGGNLLEFFVSELGV